MSIERYVYNFRWGLVELKKSLSSEGVSALRDDLAYMKLRGWYGFVQAHAELIEDFLKSTPSRRESLKKFQDHLLKRRLVLASAQRMKAACLFSEEVWTVEFVGLSYRDASVSAARQCYNLYSYRPNSYWPFDRNPPDGFSFDPEEFSY